MVDVPTWAATLVAGLLAAAVLIHVHRLNNRRAAAAKFRAAFSSALGRLEAASRHRSTHATPDADALLRQQFEAHAGAVSEFRPFVTPRQRRAFEEAWESYCALVAGAKSQPVFMAAYENDDDPWSVISARIRSILAFAPDV